MGASGIDVHIFLRDNILGLNKPLLSAELSRLPLIGGIRITDATECIASLPAGNYTVRSKREDGSARGQKTRFILDIGRGAVIQGWVAAKTSPTILELRNKGLRVDNCVLISLADAEGLFAIPIGTPVFVLP